VSHFVTSPRQPHQSHYSAEGDKNVISVSSGDALASSRRTYLQVKKRKEKKILNTADARTKERKAYEAQPK
jgi:hypothetical protein